MAIFMDSRLAEEQFLAEDQANVPKGKLMDAASSNSGPPLKPVSGLAITSLVLGILALALSFLVVGLVFGLAGCAFGWVHLARRKAPAGMARWGIGLSLLGIIASLGFGALYYSL